MSQASVGQRPKTQTNAAPQQPIIAARAGVQSQAGSSFGPRQGTQSSRPRATARVYAMTRQQAQATPEVVTGILPVSNSATRILIDPGATHSL